jgi:hypothetical protein
MKRLTAILCTALIAACGSAETEGGATEDMAAEAPSMTLADVAGSWSLAIMVDGTEEPVLSTMTGSADGSDWVLILPDRDPIGVQVSIVGDSLIGVAEQYESVLREGVMVTVRTAMVMMDGQLHGNMEATYVTADGEEVVPGTLHATRVEME